MTKRVLILEDDLETVEVLVSTLRRLEAELKTDLSVVVLAEWRDAERYNAGEADVDVVLLDRDCKAGGSFHVLNLERIGLEKVISISSTPQWNDEAVERGVKRVVWKNYQDLPVFAHDVMIQVREILAI